MYFLYVTACHQGSHFTKEWYRFVIEFSWLQQKVRHTQQTRIFWFRPFCQHAVSSIAACMHTIIFKPTCLIAISPFSFPKWLLRLNPLGSSSWGHLISLQKYYFTLIGNFHIEQPRRVGFRKGRAHTFHSLRFKRGKVNLSCYQEPHNYTNFCLWADSMNKNYVLLLQFIYFIKHSFICTVLVAFSGWRLLLLLCSAYLSLSMYV